MNWGVSPTHANTQQKVIFNTYYQSSSVFFHLPMSPSLTSPFLLLLRRRSLLLRDAPVLLQRPDGALADHRLPAELTVVDDFDDDWRHVELLAGESLRGDGGNEGGKHGIRKKKRKA